MYMPAITIERGATKPFGVNFGPLYSVLEGSLLCVSVCVFFN